MKGIRRDSGSWQVYARVAGKFLSQRYPLETDGPTLRAARDKLIALAKYGLVDPDAPTEDGPTFATDARDYLALVTKMPSYVDRKYEIGQWAHAFAGRVRATITGRDIRRVLERWRESGGSKGGPLATSSLNRRRTALMSLYTTLDGKSAVNPVRDVPPYPEYSSQVIRAHDPKRLYRIIARTRGKTRARLRLMLWTGWPQAQIMRLTKADIDWRNEAVRIAGRRKGKGTRARWVPLFPGAVIALRAFVAAEAWGVFSTSSMHSTFARAVATENAHRARHEQAPLAARPYDLRHSFGTELARRLTDERAIQELMLHSNPSQTRRYTEAATADRLLAARAAVATEAGQLQEKVSIKLH